MQCLRFAHNLRETFSFRSEVLTATELFFPLNWFGGKAKVIPLKHLSKGKLGLRKINGD